MNTNKKSQEALDRHNDKKIDPIETQSGLFQEYVKLDIIGYICSYYHCLKNVESSARMLDSKHITRSMPKLLNLLGIDLEEISFLDRTYMSVEGYPEFKVKFKYSYDIDGDFRRKCYRHVAKEKIKTLERPFLDECEKELEVWLSKITPYAESEETDLFVDKGQITGLETLGIKNTSHKRTEGLSGGTRIGGHVGGFYSFDWPSPKVLLALIRKDIDFTIGVAAYSHVHGN